MSLVLNLSYSMYNLTKSFESLLQCIVSLLIAMNHHNIIAFVLAVITDTGIGCKPNVIMELAASTRHASENQELEDLCQLRSYPGTLGIQPVPHGAAAIGAHPILFMLAYSVSYLKYTSRLKSNVSSCRQHSLLFTGGSEDQEDGRNPQDPVRWRIRLARSRPAALEQAPNASSIPWQDD